MTDLVRFETLSALAVGIVRSLAYHDGDIVKASWFMELSRSRNDVYAPPDNPEIQDLLSNTDLLLDAYAVVWPEVSEYMSTYWHDTFKALHL